MNSLPIGVFDSGLGGLTALRQLERDLPLESFVYFGDTARVPYGGRDRATLEAYAREDVAFLRSFHVKAILVACGTVSSVLLDELKDDYPFPLFGVVESAVHAAAKRTENGKIGIWGTAATIASGAYARRLAALGVQNTVSVPCPRFVPLIEAGRTAPEDPEVAAAVAAYLSEIRAYGADTLILGCTHYPLLAQAIRAEAGDQLTLIDPGKESAGRMKEVLTQADLLSAGPGGTRYFVSGEEERFARLGGAFMGKDLQGKVERADAASFR